MVQSDSDFVVIVAGFIRDELTTLGYELSWVRVYNNSKCGVECYMDISNEFRHRRYINSITIRVTSNAIHIFTYDHSVELADPNSIATFIKLVAEHIGVVCVPAQA